MYTDPNAIFHAFTWTYIQEGLEFWRIQYFTWEIFVKINNE